MPYEEQSLTTKTAHLSLEHIFVLSPTINYWATVPANLMGHSS